MYISNTALKLWAYHYGSKKPISREHFYTQFQEENTFLRSLEEMPDVMRLYHTMSIEVSELDWMDGAICCFDDEFPVIPQNIPLRDKPYLLFYKGDISLLKRINQNVAVIGYTTPTEDIQERERNIVQYLVQEQQCIVSGLAKGCDGVAHTACMEAGGKTIAILPTPLNAIYPAAHKEMVRQIIETGGLVITEYYQAPRGRQEAISRFIERDRLQAMFTKAVVLVASYEGRDGDSGSRHAMYKAYEYGHVTCAMYNGAIDKDKKEMKLNRTLLMSGKARQLTYSPKAHDDDVGNQDEKELSSRVSYQGDKTISIQEIVKYSNPHLDRR